MPKLGCWRCSIAEDLSRPLPDSDRAWQRFFRAASQIFLGARNGQIIVNLSSVGMPELPYSQATLIS